jgi:benzoyl-CoA reductase/2-hydroxyglutaryl-CoA dehydratase subunit BcrC/BadD/HgdB
MQKRPAPMTIFDAFVHLAPIVSLRGLPVALDYYQILLAELEERVDQGVGAILHERKRLMWDNIAIWYKVRDFSNLFAERGMNFVTATYTNAWAETSAHMDVEKPFESMARTYAQVILNNSLNHRLELMERLIRDYQVDGLVIHSAKAANPIPLASTTSNGSSWNVCIVPSVIIEADITDFRAFSEEQTRTRLEAFFETLETQ